METLPNLLVGTPAYNGQVQVSYVQSLLGMTASNIRFSLCTVSNDSLVSRARNTILTKFFEKSEHSHLMFLDADVGIHGEDVRKLLSHGKDVIGAPVQLKLLDTEKPVFSVGKVLERTGTLASVTQLATGVMILSRKAVEALVKSAVDENRVYRYSNELEISGDLPEGNHYDVFRQGSVEGAYVSEDYQLCRDLRNLGFDIHVDLGIRTRHFGMLEFGA